MNTLKLELNPKEWVALYGLLERQAPNPDKNLAELHNKMRAHLIQLLAGRDQFDRWAEHTSRKIDELHTQNNTLVATAIQMKDVLTDDDDEDEPKQTIKDYPRRSQPTRKRR